MRLFFCRFLVVLSCLTLGEWAGIGCARAETPIAPHRALYTMSLGAIKNGSGITDLSGRLLFEWRDMCDGWAIQQHMQLHFTYAEGPEEDIASTELTWEAKDGRSYSFTIRRESNGKETEFYRGKASQQQDGSVLVTYTAPKAKTLHLPVGTLFPSAHTSLILSQADQNNTFFTRRIFDGSDQEGVSDISAFISPSHPVEQEKTLSPDMQKNALLAGGAWPVHLAFFKTTKQADVPDYEMDLTLLPNGVARHMKIDYGDFSAVGDLSQIEPLPPANCAVPHD